VSERDKGIVGRELELAWIDWSKRTANHPLSFHSKHTTPPGEATRTSQFWACLAVFDVVRLS
jgi:hypothetical protein